MDKKRINLIALVCILPLMASAQWKAGLTSGATYNLITRDNHYMTDWHYEGAAGWTAGIFGQYDLNGFLALRTEVNWTVKSYRQYRTGLLDKINYRTDNGYLQVPLMVSFSFGGEKVKGFLNLGGYGGYWVTGYNSGSYATLVANIDEKSKTLGPRFVNGVWGTEFLTERDNRLDLGLAGGVGASWRFHRLFSVSAEARCYYSMRSFQKDYMKIKDPRYNTTFAFQAGLCYHF